MTRKSWIGTAIMAWQDSPEGLSPDWVFSNNSNVHACNDRKWFTEFTPFSSTVRSAVLTSSTSRVEGVGSVDLPVKRSPNLRGPGAHHVIRLTNVLYIPSSVSNIVGMPIFQGDAAGYAILDTPNSSGKLTDRDGKSIAYFSPGGVLFCLRLSGPPIGPRLAPSKFEPDVAYCLSIRWPEEERERWEAHCRPTTTDMQQRQTSTAQPYTAEEKAWLKKHYGGEFKFLILHNLSIYDEEDRAEGRAIVRSLMKRDEGEDDDGAEGDPSEEEDEDDEEEAGEDENDFERHLADYHFSDQELRWIKKYYRDSATFMYSFGLKFYDDEDCEDAKAIVRAFLSH
ncbi:hypothetical protein CCMA1212_010432 [Trichoderma ghanense]|uniref:Retrovirus-related Pol polyprotein from transposon TNT 1-94-like beta-barrel domain-containing protein n=1 Tax=Trichoderma ghanense TaxID=65468 RepID=A0ABY2GR88_9HYPO